MDTYHHITRQQAYDAECRRKDYLEIKRLVREYEVDDVIEMAKEAHEELKERNTEWTTFKGDGHGRGD